MFLILIVAAALTTGASRQLDPLASALPMLTLEACSIELSPLSGSADFVATVEYDAIVDRQGAIEHLSAVSRPDKTTNPAIKRFVRLDQFESCVRRWRFGGAGQYRITLQGGTMSGGKWRITVSQGGKSIRLIVSQP